MKQLIFAACLGAILLGGCQGVTTGKKSPAGSDMNTETDKANAFFEAAFTETLARSPMYQSYLGIKDQQHLWDDVSDAKAAADLEVTKRQLAELKSTINSELLEGQSLISYRLFVKNAADDIAFYRWRYHNYPVDQMHGWQSRIPSLLINIHRITDRKDAEDYISRLQGVATLMPQIIANLEKRETLGIVPPRFVFPKVISDSENVIRGVPFDDSGEDSTLLADFRDKVNDLDIGLDEKAALVNRAQEALVQKVGPAYARLIDFLRRQQQIANDDDGAWKFPHGEAFYNAALKQTTTTDLSATEIHNIGLREVARIHGEMYAIMRQVAFDGTLQDFFRFTREDPRFYYPDTAAGRKAYLERATAIIDTMKGRLAEVFITLPKADLRVKAVEAFREKSAGKAFYQRGTPDGSRPGVYYANLYRMADMPTYQMEALAYHEGIPGHHMQGSIASELEGIPKFRKYGHYTAYGEGWGLYSEYLPKEMGFYSDPYSDFGRLAMEIWRACRLVVDTGIHAKRWTREQAIDYLVANTPNPRGDIVKAIERYIVMPSQATAYKIGMNKILELRARAQQQLGSAFALREFHEVVIKNGPLPLDMLEISVDDWIASKT